MKTMTNRTTNALAMARSRALSHTQRRPVRVENQAIATAKAALTAARTRAHERRAGRQAHSLALALIPGSLEAAAFDPTEPKDGALIIAEVLRDQFNALQSEVLQRATLDQLYAAVATLNAAMAQRPTEAQVNEKVYQGIDSAVATVLPQTSNNSNAVGTFDEVPDVNYDQGQLVRFIAKVNELITALRRY